MDGKDVRRIGYSDALNRLDGSVGSTVEIRLLRVTSADVPEAEEDGEAQEPAEATTETLTVSIVRSEYSENTVSYRLINEKIGCIAISEFTSQTKEQFDAALQSLQANGAAALIFDLRNNSGGSMEVAADILDDLLPAGNLVSVKDKQGNVTVEFTSDAKEVGLPMTALVNDKTYGPAELFAAAHPPV